MNTIESLAGRLLIAMPSLGDPNFQRTVVLVAVHSLKEGAFGVVINRPLEVSLTDITDELGLEVTGGDFPPVLSGGPVEPGHGFVLFETADLPRGEDDLELPQGLAMSGSTEVLAKLASTARSSFALILGYSGWYPGQLESEIEDNSWLIAPFERSLLFDVSAADRWHEALNSIGVDPGTIVDLGSGTPT